MKLEGHAHTWRFPRQAAQGIPTAVNLRALHSLHFLGPEGADSVHLSRRGAGWGGGGGVVVVGSTCSLVWERRTTCWVTMRVPDPNIPIVRRPLPVREGRDLDHHVTACSEGAGVRGGGGGGGGGGLPRDVYTTCLCSFSPWAAQKSKFSKVMFLIPQSPKMTIQAM